MKKEVTMFDKYVSVLESSTSGMKRKGGETARALKSIGKVPKDDIERILLDGIDANADLAKAMARDFVHTMSNKEIKAKLISAIKGHTSIARDVLESTKEEEKETFDDNDESVYEDGDEDDYTGQDNEPEEEEEK